MVLVKHKGGFVGGGGGGVGGGGKQGHCYHTNNTLLNRSRGKNI